MFVLNCVDGCIPSDMATGSVEEIEEERRLLYVAVTRAKDELHLVVPQRFYAVGQARTGDRYVRVPRSRFIGEAMLGLFEIAAGPGSTERSPAVRPLPGHVVDIAAGVRGMWE